MQIPRLEHQLPGQAPAILDPKLELRGLKIHYFTCFYSSFSNVCMAYISVNV